MWRVLCVLLLLACAGWRDAAAANPRAGVEAGLALPEELRGMLPAAVLDRSAGDAARMQRLVDFMIADDGLALRYQEQPTHGIAESFALRRVNCLSFTMMFVAMARAAGLSAYAQASDDALAMRVLDDTLYRATHVNAGIQAAGERYTVDVGWQAILAGRKPQRISDARLVAMLHSNHAVERLLAGEHAAAAAAIAAALALDPRAQRSGAMPASSIGAPASPMPPNAPTGVRSRCGATMSARCRTWWRCIAVAVCRGRRRATRSGCSARRPPIRSRSS